MADDPGQGCRVQAARGCAGGGRRERRVAIKIHTNAVRAFIRHADQRGWCTTGLADALHGPRIYREHGCPLALLGATSPG
jgi:hypothetical protein